MQYVSGLIQHITPLCQAFVIWRRHFNHSAFDLHEAGGALRGFMTTAVIGIVGAMLAIYANYIDNF